MLAPTNKYNFLFGFADKSFGAICSPLQAKSNYYLLLITCYLLLPPQSLRDSSPKSGAKWLTRPYKQLIILLVKFNQLLKTL